MLGLERVPAHLLGGLAGIIELHLRCCLLSEAHLVLDHMGGLLLHGAARDESLEPAAWHLLLRRLELLHAVVQLRVHGHVLDGVLGGADVASSGAVRHVLNLVGLLHLCREVLSALELGTGDKGLAVRREGIKGSHRFKLTNLFIIVPRNFSFK